MSIREEYIKGEKALLAAATEVGEGILNGDETKFNELKNQVLILRSQYYEEKINATPEAKELISSNEEAKMVLELLDETSASEMNELKSLIEKNNEQLQDTVTYDPLLLYEKYFAVLPVKNLNFGNESMRADLNNERFSEWFSGSKVVDSNGMPLVVYHGTGGSFEEFSNFTFDSFPGAYFAENKTYSDWFSRVKSMSSGQVEGYLFNCYLKCTNPIDLTDFELEDVTYDDFVTFIEIKYGIKLPEIPNLRAMSSRIKKGEAWAWRYLRNGVLWLQFIRDNTPYDSIVYYENNPDDKLPDGSQNKTKAWLVFNGNQIKTADLRNSTYSVYSNDIRMKKGGKL
jgi:hypothetical protein